MPRRRVDGSHAVATDSTQHFRVDDGCETEQQHGCADDLGKAGPAAPVLLGKEDRGDGSHPDQAHEADNEQHRHQRPAAAQAVQAVRAPSFQCPAPATAEVMGNEERERIAAGSLAGVFPRTAIVVTSLTTTTSSASSAIDWIRAMSRSSAPSCAVDRVPRLDNLVLLGLVFLGMKGQTLKGHLDLLVLAVLATGPCHGYGVIEGLRVRSGDALDLPEGTVYPVLHRLENAGLLASEWSTECGRRRRTYQLSESGRAALNEERSAWEGFTAAVGSVLKGVPWPIPT